MKLFWKIFISMFVSFVVIVSSISYIISAKQISDAEKRIIEQKKMMGSFLSKEVEVGYFESKWPFESLNKLSHHEGVLFWWIVRDDGTIHLADNASFMGTLAHDYFPQIAGTTEKDYIFFNRKQNCGIFFTPLETGRKKWSFWFGFSMKEVSDRKREIIFLTTIVSLCALVMLGVIPYFAIKHFTKPIQELTASAETIGKGDLTHRVKIESKDELAQLAHSFNKMTDDLQKTTVSKDFVDSIIESMIDALVVVDPNEKIITVNKATFELLGYGEELLGKSVETIFPDGEEIYLKERILEKLVQEGELRNFETHLQAKEGKKITILFNGSAVKDRDGRILRIVCTARDITELKRAEEALRDSEYRYRDLVEYSQYLICTHDLKGQILSLNQGAAKNLGYDQSFLLKKNIRDFLAPDARSGFDAYLSTIQKDGAAEGMMLVQTATGEKRVWEYNNTLRTEGVTEPIVRGMAHDITEHKQVEDERERLIKELQKALAEIKQLSGLLPICSGCKKIRDDKGYWNQIEEYISDHSEAIFSHGLCPECLKKLYPDF